MANPIDAFQNLVHMHPAGQKQTSALTPKGQHDAMESACRDFESLFMNYMLQEMRKTIPQDGLLDGGAGEKIYTSMLDSAVAKEVANQRSIGLSDMLMRQMVHDEQKK